MEIMYDLIQTTKKNKYIHEINLFVEWINEIYRSLFLYWIKAFLFSYSIKFILFNGIIIIYLFKYYYNFHY